MLFQAHFPRNDRPADNRESPLEFLQRSSKPEDIQICQRMENWFDEYPAHAKTNLKSRLKSRKSQTFRGALFELQCHRMLKKAGLSVQVEPDLPGTDQKIDFLAYPPAERSRHFYLEATVAGFGKSVLMPSPNERDVIERIRKGIEKIPNLHSDVWLETDGNLPENLSNEHVRYIVGKFSELLDAHTADEVLRRDEAERLDWRVNSIGTRLVRPYKESDWTIGGHLAPYVSPSQGGRVHGPVRGGFVDGSRSLSTALRRKAEDWSRFDFADLPFIIAVNVCDPDFLWMMNNIRNALFENPDRTEPLGKFRRELHPVNAVIVVGKAVLGHERGTKAQMFRNGDAEIPESLRFILEEQKYEDILGI